MSRSVASLVVASLTVLSCANLESVNRFSSSATTALAKFDEIHVSFSQYCLERCRTIAIDSVNILREIKCRCESYKKADSITRSFHRALATYFEELSRLSGNKLTAYRTTSLSRAIAEEELGVFQVKKEEADAYGTLSEIVIRSVAGTYRRGQINNAISQANQPVGVLLSKLEFILSSNLKDLLIARRERLFNYYRTIVLSRMSDYEKQKAASDYYESVDKIEALEKEISTYSRSLRAIAAGHQKLYDKRNELSGKELWTSISPYVSAIQDLISEFEKTKWAN